MAVSGGSERLKTFLTAAGMLLPGWLRSVVDLSLLHRRREEEEELTPGTGLVTL